MRRCTSCLAQVLESDTRCPFCRQEFVTPAAKTSVAQRLGMALGVVGAGAAYTAPAAPGIDLGAAAMAGFGAVVGGTIGMIIGSFFDRARKKPEPQPEQTSFLPTARPTTRR